MAKTKATTLTTTPQNIIVQTPCTTVVVKEDESVTGGPQTNLLIVKGGGDSNFLSAGRTYTFVAPQNCQFSPGTILGTIATATGSTTGMQDEQ
jgi:hypothetical protein